jgi:hypothetical protein
MLAAVPGENYSLNHRGAKTIALSIRKALLSF